MVLWSRNKLESKFIINRTKPSGHYLVQLNQDLTEIIKVFKLINKKRFI